MAHWLVRLVKHRLVDEDDARRLLGKDDYAGVYTGAAAATPDWKQAKPIEVKGDQAVEASFRMVKIQ